MRAAAIAAALLALAAATRASAEPIEEKAVASGKAKLDPAKGYIYFHGPGRQAGSFVRIPDGDDIAAYREDWEKEFAKAQKRYAQQLARWESDVSLAKKMEKEPPEKPAEPTRETFSIGAIEQRTIETFGPEFVYSKDKGAGFYSYLTAVKPGTYIWYGPVLLDPQAGYAGVCYCMGSVKFEVKPGIVTDVGNYLLAAPQAEAQATAEMLDIRHSGGWNGYKVDLPERSGEVRFGVPASLQSWPSARADFTASGKMNNFFGLMISRLPPIPGVLAYRRDTVIDARTNTPLAAPPAPGGQ